MGNIVTWFLATFSKVLKPQILVFHIVWSPGLDSKVYIVILNHSLFDRRNRFIPFPGALSNVNETDSTGVWTLPAGSTFCTNKRYATRAFSPGITLFKLFKTYFLHIRSVQIKENHNKLARRWCRRINSRKIIRPAQSTVHHSRPFTLLFQPCCCYCYFGQPSRLSSVKTRGRFCFFFSPPFFSPLSVWEKRECLPQGETQPTCLSLDTL